MTIELSKYKERDALQMNELADLRQSSVLFERVSLKNLFLFYIFSNILFSQEKLNLQVEFDSLRSKLIEEEIAHKKLQEQFLSDKLKRVGTRNATDEDIKNDNQEIIKGIYLIFNFFSNFFSSSIQISKENQMLNVYH